MSLEILDLDVLGFRVLGGSIVLAALPTVTVLEFYDSGFEEVRMFKVKEYIQEFVGFKILEYGIWGV